MKVLGIDTSTSCGSIGLVEDGKVISEFLLDRPETHSERLIRGIELLLKESHLSIHDLDGWVISLGPGSFTGLRIGVSTIKGLAFATNKPIVGVSTLDVLAFQISPTPYLICPVIDARKGEVYTAFYRYQEKDSLKRISPYRALRPEELIHQIKEKTLFVGDGVKSYGDYFKKALPTFTLYPPWPLHFPHGSALAILGIEILKKGVSLDLSSFTPLYIRPSEAELKWKERDYLFK